MTNKEKEIIRKFEIKLKEKYETDTREELIKFLDKFAVNMLLMGFSDEFLEKMFFIRYYYINVCKQEVMKND